MLKYVLVLLLVVLTLFHFLFNTAAPTDIYTLSLHDALPILTAATEGGQNRVRIRVHEAAARCAPEVEVPDDQPLDALYDRSEEHTSELQSHSDLVCRLLLEKKKNKQQTDYGL